MTVWQGIVLLLGAIGVVAVSFLNNVTAHSTNWKPTFKAGGYLVGAALLLILSPQSDSLGGWGAFMCLIIAVLSVWIVAQLDTEQILEDHRYNWRYGKDSNGDPRSGLKLLYGMVRVFDRIDGFMWKKIGPFVLKKRNQVARLRYGRRFVFGVLMVLVILSWTLPLIFGLFSSDEPPAMGMGTAAGTTQTQSAPPSTEAASATTTPPATTITPATAASASTESLDQSCAGPPSSDLKVERTENVDFGVKKDLWVCRDGGQWLAWKEGTAPATVTILSWTEAVAPEDGSTYVYAVIEANAKQYYVKSVPKE